MLACGTVKPFKTRLLVRDDLQSGAGDFPGRYKQEETFQVGTDRLLLIQNALGVRS
jgi:hypothetical protein